MIIAPSLLTSDLSAIGEAAEEALNAGLDWLHLDVMDGVFVPNLTFGPPLLSALRKRLGDGPTFDTHLMISNAEDSWQQYIEAGCNHLTFHVESVTHLHRLVTAVTDAGVGVGVAINPSTPLSAIEEVLPHLDLVLVMTVNPGFGGQSFIADLKGKIQKLRNLIDVGGKKTILQVDGGVKADNIDMLSEWGVDNVVVGSGLYNKTDSVAGNLANLLSKLD